MESRRSIEAIVENEICYSRCNMIRVRCDTAYIWEFRCDMSHDCIMHLLFDSIDTVRKRYHCSKRISVIYRNNCNFEESIPDGLRLVLRGPPNYVARLSYPANYFPVSSYLPQMPESTKVLVSPPVTRTVLKELQCMRTLILEGSAHPEKPRKKSRYISVILRLDGLDEHFYSRYILSWHAVSTSFSHSSTNTHGSFLQHLTTRFTSILL